MNAITATGLALVATGGALGSMARYVMGTCISQWLLSSPHHVARFPWGTWSVNLFGCLVIGLMAGLANRFDWLTHALRLFLFTGLMGGFTTFSAFGLETLNLVLHRQWPTAFAYVIGSVVLGLLATGVGFWLTAGSHALPPSA